MKPSLPLLYTAILIGKFSWTAVMRSPSSMEKPPSPARQTTCRPGWLFCSPSAEDMPLAPGFDVAKRPDQRSPVVRGEHGVLGGVLVDDLCEVGTGNGVRAGRGL